MSNARKLAANLPNEGQFSGRNIIINGAMEIAQRGTSHTSAGVGSIDRMSFALSGGTGTMSQQYMTVNDKSTTGFAHYMRMDLTSGNNNAGLYYKIEARDIERLQGKKVTLSFWAKGTNPGGGNFHFGHYWYDSLGGDQDVGTSQNFSVTSTWAQYSLTFDLATASNVIVGNNPQARYDISILQPASDTSTNAWQLDITGLMLEVGEQASPFEHEPYETTLRKCQRYYYELNGIPNGKHVGGGVMRDSQYFYGFPVTFPTPMRVIPTFSYAGVTPYVADASNGFATLSPAAANTDNFSVNGGAGGAISGASAGSSVLFYLGVNANHYFRFNAEL